MTEAKFEFFKAKHEKNLLACDCFPCKLKIKLKKYK